MISYNTLILLLGTGLYGACAGFVGSFVVLRGRAMLGDALSHCCLPGIVISFLLLGEKNLALMLAGAGVSALLGMFLIAMISRYTKLKQDAAIAIVLSVLFGLGLVLSRYAQNMTTGGSKAGLDSYIRGKTASLVAEDVLLIGCLAGLTLVFISVFFKEFKILLFDRDFAELTGLPVNLLDWALLLLLTLAIVFGVPTVGILLVSGMTVLPAAVMSLWSRSFAQLVIGATLIGVLSALAGSIISVNFESVAVGPAILLSATFALIVSALVAPERGLLARSRLIRRQRADWRRSELLSLLKQSPSAIDGSTPQVEAARQLAERDGLIDQRPDGTWQLTAAGEQHHTRLQSAKQQLREYLDAHPAFANGLTLSMLADPDQLVHELDRVNASSTQSARGE